MKRTITSLGQVSLLIAVTLYLNSIFSGNLFAQTPASTSLNSTKPVSLSLDFSAGEKPITHCASGILLALTATTPPDDYILPLKLKGYRTWDVKDYPYTPALAQRVQGLGIEHLQMILYNCWDSRYPGVEPGDQGNWTPWEQFVDSFYQETKDRNQNWEWDIWNEPNGDLYFHGDQAKYLEMWKRGVRKLRANNPKAQIVGPSIWHLDMDWLGKFLTFAKENDVMPDILSWHELSDTDGRSVPSHVASVKSFLKDHDMKIERMSINEIMPESFCLSPAVATSYFDYLEQTGVESAMHTCWNDANGSMKAMNGFPPYLDGMLTLDTKVPRSLWWAYKTYANMSGQFIPVTIDPKSRIDGFAGNDPSKQRAIILLSSCEVNDLVSDVSLSLSNLDHLGSPSGGPIHVKMESIPFSYQSPLTFMGPLSSQKLDASSSTAILSIPKLHAQEACVITLQRGPDSAKPTQ